MEGDLIVTINGFYYDLTEFIKEYPQYKSDLEYTHFKDLSNYFYKVFYYDRKNLIYKILKKYRLNPVLNKIKESTLVENFYNKF